MVLDEMLTKVYSARLSVQAESEQEVIHCENSQKQETPFDVSDRKQGQTEMREYVIE